MISIKIWETTLSWHAKCSLPVYASQEHALKLFNVAWTWPNDYKIMQKSKMLQEKFDRFQIWSNIIQYVATSQPGGQNCATCCAQQCCKMLRSVQTLATLLGPTCCECLHTMLCVVACCCDLLEVVGWSLILVKLQSHQVPTFLLFRGHRSMVQNCCADARALHATYPHKYMRKRNQHGVGDGKRPRVLCILI